MRQISRLVPLEIRHDEEDIIQAQRWPSLPRQRLLGGMTSILPGSFYYLLNLPRLMFRYPMARLHSRALVTVILLVKNALLLSFSGTLLSCAMVFKVLLMRTLRSSGKSGSRRTRDHNLFIGPWRRGCLCQGLAYAKMMEPLLLSGTRTEESQTCC